MTAILEVTRCVASPTPVPTRCGWCGLRYAAPTCPNGCGVTPVMRTVLPETPAIEVAT